MLVVTSHSSSLELSLGDLDIGEFVHVSLVRILAVEVLDFGENGAGVHEKDMIASIVNS